MAILSSNVMTQFSQLQSGDLIGKHAYTFSLHLVFAPVIFFWAYSKIKVQNILWEAWVYYLKQETFIQKI